MLECQQGGDVQAASVEDFVDIVAEVVFRDIVNLPESADICIQGADE